MTPMQRLWNITRTLTTSAPRSQSKSFTISGRKSISRRSNRMAVHEPLPQLGSIARLSTICELCMSVPAMWRAAWMRVLPLSEGKSNTPAHLWRIRSSPYSIWCLTMLWNMRSSTETTHAHSSWLTKRSKRSRKSRKSTYLLRTKKYQSSGSMSTIRISLMWYSFSVILDGVHKSSA